MKSIFLLLSVLLPIYSPWVYAKSILRGEAKPHRTTQFVLLVITLLTTSSLLAQNDRVAIWLAAVSAFQGVVIFILSLKYGMGGWAKTDLFCLLFAGLGIILWQTTHDPAVGLYFSIAADCIGMIPTLIKTYHAPETENMSFFALDSVAAGFNLLAHTSWGLTEITYPLYLLLINFTMVLLILHGKKFPLLAK